MIWKALVVWLVIILAEMIHGVLRTILLQPRVGDLRSRQIGVFTGSVIILAIAVIFVPWVGAANEWQQLGVGLLWLGLTVGFEFSFGRFVMRQSWERIICDYDPRKGGLLPVGLLLMTLSPWIAVKLRELLNL